MLLRISLVICGLSVVAFGQRISYPQFVLDPSPAGENEVAALSLSNGDTVFVGTGGHIVRLNSAGAPAANEIDRFGYVKNSPVQLGTGADIASCALVDDAGNIWIAGSTSSPDFPLVNPISTKMPAHGEAAFLLELDSTASTILFSTFLGGTKGDYAEINAMALDSKGNVYVAGDTDLSDFPTTLPEFGSGLPFSLPADYNEDSNAITLAVYGFVVKVNTQAVPTLGWSALLGGSQFLPCIPAEGYCAEAAITFPANLIVDSTGALIVAGASNTMDFPVTPGAFQAQCSLCYGAEAGFVTRISGDGKSLLWSTYLGNPSSVLGLWFSCGTAITAAVLDPAGNVAVAGNTCGNVPVSADALQRAPPEWGTQFPVSSGFAAKLSADGGSLLYATYLGGVSGSNVTGTAVDRSGNVWVAGTTLSLDFLPAPATPLWGEDFLVELKSDASGFQHAMRLPTGTASAGVAIDPNGDLLLLAGAGSASRIDPAGPLVHPAVFALTNGASFLQQTGLCPLQLSAIFGAGLSPSPGVSAVPDANGAYPTELGGVEVLVGGIPAPLFYAGPNQINFQAPDFSNVDHPTIHIRTAAGWLEENAFDSQYSLGVIRNMVTPNAPGTMLETAIASALNQDLTVNSAQNPAAPGSIVTLFLTEPGMPSGGSPVGSLAVDASSVQIEGPGIEITYEDSTLPLPVLYAGTAPGMTNAVIQVNVMLTEGGGYLTVSAPELGISDSVYVW